MKSSMELRIVCNPNQSPILMDMIGKMHSHLWQSAIIIVHPTSIWWPLPNACLPMTTAEMSTSVICHCYNVIRHPCDFTPTTTRHSDIFRNPNSGGVLVRAVFNLQSVQVDASTLWDTNQCTLMSIHIMPIWNEALQCKICNRQTNWHQNRSKSGTPHIIFTQRFFKRSRIISCPLWNPGASKEIWLQKGQKIIEALNCILLLVPIMSTHPILQQCCESCIPIVKL